MRRALGGKIYQVTSPHTFARFARAWPGATHGQVELAHTLSGALMDETSCVFDKKGRLTGVSAFFLSHYEYEERKARTQSCFH
jgi:hypothetical protein